MTASTSTVSSQTPEPAEPSKPSNAIRALWIAIAVVAVSVLGGILLAAALFVGGSDTEVTSTADESGTEELSDAPAEDATAQDAPAEDTAAVDAAAQTSDGTEELLMAFAETWRTADWTEMATLASSDVVTVAQEWHSEGGEPNITDDNMEFIIETCHMNANGGTDCFFVYAPPEGFGLIFNITLADNGTGLSVTQLTFGGDAG